MAYYRKNKRRFDPRYFMNERMEDEEENDGDAGETLPGEEEPEYGEEKGQDVPLEEMIPGDPGLPSAKFGGFLGDDDEKEFPGGTTRDIPSATAPPVSTSLGSKPATKASGGSLLSVAQQMKNLYNAVEKHKKDHEEKERIFRPKMAVEGCGDAEELPWVEMDGGKLTAASEDDFASILNTAEIWQRGGIEIINGRADILDALGIESPNSEALPDLMDEEPPLEE
jgi:hypothetical protein